MAISDFNIPHRVSFLGQRVNQYEVPLDIFGVINKIYESQINTLPSAHQQLVGKIKKEHSLYNSLETPRMKKHSALPAYILDWLKVCSFII